MKIGGLSILILIILILIVLQSIGGYIQIKDYQKAVRRMHQLGNVGLGQRRPSLFNGDPAILSGHVAIIACDNEGIITGAEVMDGISVWSKFHPVDTFMDTPLVGTSIFTFLRMGEDLDKKAWKRRQGYFRAFEALEARITGKELTREQEAFMETRRGKKGKKLR